MSALAPTLQAFFTDRLRRQREASDNTIAAYRDAWRLLLAFAQVRLGRAPSRLQIDDLDAPLIAAFLDHLQRERGNGVRTRNARLAAIHSFFRFAALEHPEHAGMIKRVLAVPAKRLDRALVSFLTAAEQEALLAAPDRATWIGRRDHALLLLAKYHARAVAACPSLRAKHVTPHVLRHTAAMRLLEAGVDTSVIALWLGHERVETTQIYLHADLALKERALARTTPPGARPGRYRPPDALLAFLEAL